MPDHPTPAQALDRITADALALRSALRSHAGDHAHALAARITDAQALAGSCLRLFLDLVSHTPRTTSADLMLLDRVGHIVKAAQAADVELAAALARAVENQRRRADATSEPVVFIGPSPEQFIKSAADLLDRIPALSHAIHRDQLMPPTPHTHQPH